MKRLVQQAHEKQELSSPNRIKQFEYSFSKCQGDSSRVSSVRNIRERFETGAGKGNALRNGNSYHYSRSDSVKSRISDNGVDACGGDTVLSAKTKVSVIAVVNGTPPDIAVANGTLSIGSSVNCSDGSFIADHVDSTQHKPNGSSELLRPSFVGPDKAQDRLVKSQSYIEQLQQNLATKLSTATVETFRHKYSPTLDPHSRSKARRPQLIGSNRNENSNHHSREAVGSSSLTDGNQAGDRNNRQTPVPKGSVGKGDTPVSEFKSRKLPFLGVIFRPADTRPTRKLTNSHKNDTSIPDGSADSGQFLKGAAHPVDNELTQLRSEYRNKDFVDSSPHVTSQNGLKGEVKNSDSVTSKTTDKDREATVQGNNSSSLTPFSCVNNPNCGKLSDESQQQTYTIPKSVDAVPPPKPARVSWTTRLIQKLTEEEEKRKTRSQTKVQKPKRIVGFPQKKVSKVVNQYKAKASEESKKETPSPLVLQPATEVSAKADTGSDSVKEETKENPSGVVLDEDSRDGYANLVSQLTDSKNEDNEQVSELNGEDLLLKQERLEELRATLAREECGSTSSDDDSALSAAITASTGSIEAGRRKEPKPSGIRRLLPHGLFVQRRQHLDRAEEDAALERLLKHSDASRVHPATNIARPVLETAFLSDSNSKLPVRSAIRQQQRAQSSSPASRHKQTSPRSRRRQKDADQKSIQENEQNSSKISSQTRSKSLSPARDRRSSATNSTSRRTIPDTSLVLEERLQHIRRELSPPPARDVRPSSTPPTDNLKRVSQSSDKILQRQRVYQNARGVYSDTPDGAYYHSPPIRRRQQNKDPEIDHKADDKQRKVSGGSSTSSTSTIVAESLPVSALSWNPILLNLENQALSGSPDIRELQQQRQTQHSSHDGQHYGGFQNIVHRDSRTDSPDIYYHPNSGLAGKPKRLPDLYQDPSKLRSQLRSSTSVPSGRLSAPPVSSYNIEDYPRRRVISPEPPRNRQEYQHELSSKRSLSQPPRSRQSNHTASTQPSFQPALPTDKRFVSPVAAHLLVTSQSRPREAENANSKETQTASSYMQQQYRQLAVGLRSNSQPHYKKLSRQEVEALYWETQKLRQGLSSLSQHISPSPMLGERFLSTSALPQPPPPAHHSAVRSEQNSPMFYQPEAVPRQPFRTQSVQNVGSGYGSVIVRPQPMYNIAQQYQLMQQSRASNDANIRVSRARSASPGPNSNRHLTSRSLSLPRSIPVLVMPEGSAHKASDDTVDYFKRGVPQRNTIGPIRTASHSPQIRQLSTPTIYEESPQNVGEDTRVLYAERQKHGTKVDGRGGNKSNTVSNSKSQNSVDTVENRRPLAGDANDYKKPVGNKKNKKSASEDPMSQQTYYPPIFKRGSLISTSTGSVDGVDSPVSPKRVSFISSYTDEPRNWPTRNGPAPEPPTRQRRLQSMDSDVFLPSEEYSTYANVPEAPNRPLPPIPRDVNGTAYGVILRKSRDAKSPAGAVPVAAHRWQQQSESESGSEAGEVQRILQQGGHGRGTYFRFA
ncbi:hypothetical protein, partial [Coptotermes formosanus]